MNTTSKPIEKYWICDICDQPIIAVADGWVEWYLRQTGKLWTYSRVRLVHHCTFHSPEMQERVRMGRWRIGIDDELYDCPLSELLGEGGRTELLSMLEGAAGPNTELLKMFKRLHVPGYERMRFHYGDAIQEGIIPQSSTPGYPTPEDIDTTYDTAGKEASQR